METSITYTMYLQQLAEQFPEIEEELLDEDYEGLITLQTGVFKRFIQKAILDNDEPILKRSFKYLNDNFELFDDKVQNSIVVSLLEHLELNSTANNLLPVKIRSIINQLSKKLMNFFNKNS
jgi:predicted nucleic acid-binding OB-fold protein